MNNGFHGTFISKRNLTLYAVIILLFLSYIPTSLGSNTENENDGVLVTFSEVTEESGFGLVDTGPETIWSSYGPGISVDDCDGDGDMDVLVTARFDHLKFETESKFPEGTDPGTIEAAVEENSSGNTQFMINNGDGTFTDWTDESGLGLVNTTVIGASWADYDNDGDKDVYLSNFGETDVYDISSGARNYLYQNNGNCVFIDVTSKTGVGQGATGEVVIEDGEISGIDEEKFWARTETNFLFRNEGDIDDDGEIEFSDATKEAGVSGQKEVSDTPNDFFISILHRMDQASPSNPSTMAQIDSSDSHGSGLSFAGVWFDYDGDGWEDLYVASDFGISPIYHNNQDGTFSIVTDELEMDIPGTGMGAHAGDWDGDGDLDLCHSNFGPNYLWENNEGNSFTENGGKMGFRELGGGTSFVAVNWACQFFDYDLDGDLDIFFGVGRINRFSAYNNNTFFRNEGDTNGDGITDFIEISDQIGLGGAEKTMGTSIFDYDGDGDLDIILGQAGRSPQIFSNNAVEETGRNWLKVKLNGMSRDVEFSDLVGDAEYSNKFGAGCLVTVTLKDGTKMQQHVYAGSGYLGSNEPTVHFGLGDYDSVKSVEVLWTTGMTDKVENVESNQILVIDESSSIFYSLFGFAIPETKGFIFCLGILFVLLLANKTDFLRKNDSGNLISQQDEEE